MKIIIAPRNIWYIEEGRKDRLIEDILLPKISNKAGNKKYQNLAFFLIFILGSNSDSIISDVLDFFLPSFNQ